MMTEGTEGRWMGGARGRGRRGQSARAFALLLVALAGCQGRTNLDPASIRLPAGDRLTDAQVVAIAREAYFVQAQQSWLAVDRAATTAVREHAYLVAYESEALTDDLDNLIEELGIVPADHAAVRQLRSGFDGVVRSIVELDEAGVSRAYLNRQMQLDRWFLTMLEYAILPNLRDPYLRRHLNAARVKAEAHFAEGQRLAAAG